MAKGCYVGPIRTIKIDETNINDFFEVTNSTYGFEWTTVNGLKCLAPTNYDAGRSTATMTLKAKCDIDRIYLKYTYNIVDMESGVTFKVGSTYVLNGANGTKSNVEYSSDPLKAGDIITFSYTNMVNSINPSTDSAVFADLRILSNPYAKKVKNIYIGVPTTVPIYETVTTPVTIDVDNINDFFEVTNSTYYFEGSDTVFAANNLGVNSTTATTTLKLKQDVTNLSFQYNYITEANYDKFTIKIGSTTVLSAVSGTTTGANLTTYNAGDLTAGTILTFSYSKDSSQSASGEACYFTSMTFTTEMTTQTGTETKSVARKIKKGYVGVGGVARPCWGGGELTSYGNVNNGLSLARTSLAATTIGDYALFGGGYDTSGRYVSNVDAYDKSLTRTTPTSLSTGRRNLAATTVGDYALFGGGFTSGTAVTNVVNAYDTSLTRTSASTFTLARGKLAATTVGNYALFGGGYTSSTVVTAVVHAYNTSLTRTSPTSLGDSRGELAATTVGDYALFGGGSGSSTYSALVDAYDTSLTRTSADSFDTAVSRLAATTVGNYALFGGGYTGSDISTVTEAYDTSLTRTSPTSLSTGRYYLAATSIGEYAIFAGGYTGSDVNARVDIYDSLLTRKPFKYLYTGRQKLAATTVGNYALFGGGDMDSSPSLTVDAFTIA